MYIWNRVVKSVLGFIQMEEAEQVGIGGGRSIRVEKGIESTQKLRVLNNEKLR